MYTVKPLHNFMVTPTMMQRADIGLRTQVNENFESVYNTNIYNVPLVGVPLGMPSC